MLDLIYDRTKGDADRAEALIRLIDRVTWDGLTPEQKEEWDLPLKGRYDYRDFNRVAAAVTELINIFGGLGYLVDGKPRAWVDGEAVSFSQLQQYLADIAAIRAALAVYPTTPTAPTGMDALTVQEANDIERILADVDELITKMIAAYRHSGTFHSGQGGLIV